MEEVIHWFGPLHPPVVHFPVVCPILAVLALLAYRFIRKSWFLEATAWLWVLSFLSALGAVMTGHLFSIHLGLESTFAPIPAKTVLKGALREHVLWAMGSFFLSMVSFVESLKILRKKPWPFGVQLALGFSTAFLFGVTGHKGGEMVFGPNENPLPAISASGSVTAQGSDLLGQAAGYRQNLVKMNAREWNSRTHGHRWVNVYVSQEAAKAYEDSESLPMGALVVKESFEDAGGKPSTEAGTLYVMRKGKSSDSLGTGGWKYALEWDKPVPGNPEGIQFPVKWLPGDPNLSSCVKCHGHFKGMDYMGGVPEGFERKN